MKDPFGLEQQNKERETFTCWSCDQDESIDEYAGDSRNGHMLCTSCVSNDWTYCENCSVYVLDRYFNGDMNMCGKCCDEYCIECVDCCSLHYRDDMYWSDYDGEPRCGDCHDMHGGTGLPGVYDYHHGAPFMMTYRRDSVRFTEAGDHVYYGVELESEDYPNDMGDILERLSNSRVGHAEMDGSLDCGAEFITQPSDLASWRGEYGNTIKTYMSEVAARGGEFDRDTCGTHVHVSRTAFKGDSHLARFATFMVHNPDFVWKVSGREELDQWCRVTKLDKGQMSRSVKRKQGDRYRAVNLNNHATVEVRMFAGSNDYDEVLGYVEFVAALVEYTRDITVNHIMAGALLAESFTTWLEDTELNDYSKARKLVAYRTQR